MFKAFASKLLIQALRMGANFITAAGRPQVAGLLVVPGLEGKIEILRDRWGVPHIYADSVHDLFFGQGFVHAQDRLWQMEAQRRVGTGRLAEILGVQALDVDCFTRTVGLRRTAEKEAQILDPEGKAILQAYQAGINACICSLGAHLPPEFRLLRVQPESWQPLDSLAWYKVIIWILSGNWENELVRANLIARVGPERAAHMDPYYDQQHPTILPRGVKPSDYADLGADALASIDAARELLGGPEIGMGSNNWVVSGVRTASGKPLLANDPHLPMLEPNIWFQNHLVGGGLDVIGASLPGLPGVIFGHNAHVAWGGTAGMADTQDLFMERFNPDHPMQYAFRGVWRQADLAREVIHVQGQTDVVLDIPITHHGPIINAVLPGLHEHPLALAAIGLQPIDSTRGLFGLNRARNWGEFRQALFAFSGPCLNMVYADVAGNIGYQFVGYLPRRARGDGTIPVPGWTGEYEWEGMVPPQDLPYVLNPLEGLIVTANNQVVDDSHSVFIGREYIAGFRAVRIRQLLEAKPALTITDFRHIQMDFFSLPAEACQRCLAEIATADRELRSALDRLLAWDCRLLADSAEAATYEAFLYHLMANTFLASVGVGYLGQGSQATLSPINMFFYTRGVGLLLDWLNDPDTPWYAHVGQFERSETRDEIVLRSLRQGLAELKTRLGPNTNAWRWGDLHSITFNHILGAQKPLDKLFNRGPYPIGGDTDTVHQAGTWWHEPYHMKGAAPSWRFIADLADWEQCQSILAPGQSGHPASHHYDDAIQPWLDGDHFAMPFSREAVEANLAGKLVLRPSSLPAR